MTPRTQEKRNSGLPKPCQRHGEGSAEKGCWAAKAPGPIHRLPSFFAFSLKTGVKDKTSSNKSAREDVKKEAAISNNLL